MIIYFQLHRVKALIGCQYLQLVAMPCSDSAVDGRQKYLVKISLALRREVGTSITVLKDPMYAV